MNKNDLIRLKTKIIAMLADLEVTTAGARSALKESSETITNFLKDESDSVKGELDLNNAVCVHNHSAESLALLRDAFARMENGSYGVCHECGEDISVDRLETIPTATRCISCQENSESRFFSGISPLKSMNHVQVRWSA